MPKRKFLLEADPLMEIIKSPEFKKLMNNAMDTRAKVVMEVLKDYEKKKTIT